ncbi:hypothetical protein PUNSTDRAFT_123981 [Punctularia strigosozonata HHB-11173 SS5]|uniref:uncharacterized protein n=1 Tax=Punctularia strigosozonata (strain HHB-11173) TaxID=741275 RepID=UPI00044172A9|nr:uncharacterized protein PUNSTDRAFT_123981 [Punctularia strigosozonata HHB-11173 SS5]EIN14432.1 hypothetical protein PUNSTDRAFT_123981 [Punctularia strigosozonata HHB-11173 SS5]
MDATRGVSSRPFATRRHTAHFKPRSSPLAGPVLSTDSGHGVGDTGDLKPRYRPSRISSTPDLPALDRNTSECSETATTSTHETYHSNYSLVSSSHASEATTVASHSVFPDDKSVRRRTLTSLRSGRSANPDSTAPFHPTPGHRTTSSTSGRTLSSPSTSRNPDENWLTAKTTPRFSRYGMNAPGVVMPVPARNHPSRASAKRPRTAPGNPEVVVPRFNGGSRSAPSTIGVTASRNARPAHGRAQTYSLPAMSAALSPRSRSASTPTLITPIFESSEEFIQGADVDNANGFLIPPPPSVSSPKTSSLTISPSSLPSLTRSESGDESAIMASDVSTSTIGSIGTLAPDPSLAFYMRGSSSVYTATTVSAASLSAENSDIETVKKGRRFAKLAATFKRTKPEKQLSSSLPAVPALILTAHDSSSDVGDFGQLQSKTWVSNPDRSDGRKKGPGLWRRFAMSVTSRRTSRGSVASGEKRNMH